VQRKWKQEYNKNGNNDAAKTVTTIHRF